VNTVELFLGVPETAPPAAMLAIEGAPTSRVQIETALRERLEEVHRHPEGRSAEADEVRRVLRRAAETLIADYLRGGPAKRSGRPGAKPVRPAPPVLTEFDRYVLAVLVGCGGWNASSRAQLVALAGSYGVGPTGLLKVVTGLSEYARSGGSPLGVAEITSGAARVIDPRPAPAATPRATEITANMARMEPESDVWFTIKLSAGFGLLTILVAILFLRSVLSRPDAETISAAVNGEPATEIVDAQPTPMRSPASSGVALVTFRPLPTFLGNALPMAATDAADQAPQVPDDLDLVARRLSIADDPSEAVFKSWEVALDTIASGWVLADLSTREAIDRAVHDVLHETTDTPSTGDRLLSALGPPRGALASPIEVWRGSWKAGMLGSISRSANLPPSVIQRARGLLGLALGDPGPDPIYGFVPAAAAWLDAAAAAMTEAIELDPDSFDARENLAVTTASTRPGCAPSAGSRARRPT